MIKKILILIIIYWVCINDLFANNIVKKLKINGHNRTDPTTILVNHGLDASHISENDISKYLKTLYETNLFSDIQTDSNNDEFVITVKENPIINKCKIHRQ